MKLTKTILRNAAALLAPGGTPDKGSVFHRHAAGDDYEFMCYAVNAAAYGEGQRVDEDTSPAVQAFEALLCKHGVGVGGYLPHNGERYAPYTPGQKGTAESQALRFDFLNLLAESL